MIQLTDAHAHIKNEKQAMERITLGIPTMACAGTPGEMQELEKFGRLQGVEKILIPACGLHPWYSDKWEPEEMFSLMEKVPVIGEIGMDSVWCDVPLDRQRKALEKQLQFACEIKKPVVLHTKGQEKEIARIISHYPNTYLVHWFSGDTGLEDYLKLDCYFSIGPDILWNPAVQKVSEQVPENRILIETDGMEAVDWAYEEGKKQGFLKEKKENLTPETSLFETLKTTAGLRNCEPEALAEAVYANFYRFISVHMVVWRSDKLLKTGLVN